MEIFDPFFKFIAGVLSFFYSVVPSYGLSIILLTVAVMIVITPLTYKSTKSMLQMQRLQPELKQIQAKYKDDRERLNQELMAFYKENNLNPLGGCLPLIIQGPVFIVLYRVLHGLTTRFGGAGSGAGHIAGQLYPPGRTLTPWRITDQPFNPTYVNTSSELYKSLSNHSKMNFLGIDLSLTPIQAFKIGVWTAVPFIILIGLMTAAQVVQNRQIQGRNKNQTTSAQQQAIMKFLPFMLPVISLNFPAGLGIYYLVQSLCRIGTQGYITKSLYGDGASSAVVAATAVDVDAGGSGDDSSPRASRKKEAPDQRGSANGASNGVDALGNGKRSTANSAAAKPVPAKRGSSAKSQAAQQKTSGGASPKQAGRKSGAPRSPKSRDGRTSGNPDSPR